MMIRAAILIPLVLGFCKDETLTGYGATGKIFVLETINGADFPGHATISFPGKGRIAGKGPCNSFTATQLQPYPWFQAGPIAATKRHCAKLSAELLYFQALSVMTQSEVSGPHLILSTSEGDAMEFKAEE